MYFANENTNGNPVELTDDAVTTANCKDLISISRQDEG